MNELTKQNRGPQGKMAERENKRGPQGKMAERQPPRPALVPPSLAEKAARDASDVANKARREAAGASRDAREAKDAADRSMANPRASGGGAPDLNAHFHSFFPYYTEDGWRCSPGRLVNFTSTVSFPQYNGGHGQHLYIAIKILSGSGAFSGCAMAESDSEPDFYVSGQHYNVLLARKDSTTKAFYPHHCFGDIIVPVLALERSSPPIEYVIGWYATVYAP